jgi:alpha-ketoglutarate-dependent taurine dioxygenase
VQEVIGALEARGFVHLRGAGEAAFEALLPRLGRTLHVEEIVVRPESRALVTSRRALAPHTDHARAARIAWYCHAQTELGGDTVLVDALDAWARVPPAQRERLGRVRLFEHAVFPGDPETHPLVTFEAGRPRFYYSFWLADEAMPEPEREALARFHEAVRESPEVRLRLEPGDVLVVDNGRILHGRTAIEGRPTRRLRRVWLV